MHLGKVGLAALAAYTMLVPARAATAQEREVREIRRFMIAGGGHLGVVLDEVDAKSVERLKLKEERGAVVREVRPDTPAAAAGLQVDDVIVAYQGEPIESALALARRVRETPPGRRVGIEIVRQGAPQKMTATIGERQPGPFNMPPPDMTMPELPKLQLPEGGVPHGEMPEGAPGSMGGGLWKNRTVGPAGPRKLGLEFQPISGQLAEHFKVTGEHALLVVSVQADGPAAKAGVKAGDVLVRLGASELAGPGELHEAVAQAKPGDETTLTVQRDGRPLDLKIVIGGTKSAAPPPAKKKDRI